MVIGTRTDGSAVTCRSKTHNDPKKKASPTGPENKYSRKSTSPPPAKGTAARLATCNLICHLDRAPPQFGLLIRPGPNGCHTKAARRKPGSGLPRAQRQLSQKIHFTKALHRVGQFRETSRCISVTTGVSTFPWLECHCHSASTSTALRGDIRPQ